MGKNKPHIVIIDDDEVLQYLLKECLSENHYSVTSLSRGEKLPSLFDSELVDLVVLDLLIPEGKDGLYWLSWLQQNHSSVPVIMLSSKGDVEQRIKGLAAGAKDYLPKPFDQRELLLKINNHISIEKQVDLYQVGSFEFEPELNELKLDGETIRLSPTEGKLLNFLCRNEGKTLTRDMISHALNGREYSAYDRSIDVHINNLRKKLQIQVDMPKMIQSVRGKGYRFVPRAL
jgi:DNA-binding response OmpR family regulator